MAFVLLHDCAINTDHIVSYAPTAKGGVKIAMTDGETIMVEKISFKAVTDKIVLATGKVIK